VLNALESAFPVPSLTNRLAGAGVLPGEVPDVFCVGGAEHPTAETRTIAMSARFRSMVARSLLAGLATVLRYVNFSRPHVEVDSQFFAIAAWAALRVVSPAQTLVWSEFSTPSFFVAG
jgi:hypothetical protein